MATSTAPTLDNNATLDTPGVNTKVTLDDKYTVEAGRVYLSGIQALVRLPMMQRQRDLKAGLNTGGFISGYRGSPLGGYDQALWKAKAFLENNHIKFQPGLNEDLAMTSVWGTQQLNLFPGAKYDGVFALWYGKGPGVDRCGDVMKHGNAAGTSKHGGVLLIAGDDHGAASSTLPHQSDHMFTAAMVPLLYPSTVQEVLDFGLYGIAMSRYSGVWVAFKCVTENLESAASVTVDPDRMQFREPNNFEMPAGGVHIRTPDGILEQEDRLQRYKVYAALAFARTNRIDRVVIDAPKPRLGIISAGKSYLDVRQALDDLGIDDKLAAEIGIRLYKVGMIWPLERDGVREFAEGLEEIVVVEEKRALIENQMKEQLYNWKSDVRPRVVGKFDEHGEWLLPASDELTPAMIARVLAQRITRFYQSPQIADRLKFLEAKERILRERKPNFDRLPYFCSGCPHNTSTKVPEGSRAMAGIGCHFMAQWMDRSTATFTHMGGEGAPWIGQAPFTETNHVFTNLGDGTYYHSGLLAIRAACAANVNITYKILYNDAVAMTGGQPVEGGPTVWQISLQVYAEGVKRIALVSDEPTKYPIGTEWAPGVTFHHRDDLDQVQKDLREWPGVSVLLYDQTCAAEKRRRRKRGLMFDPPKRPFINERVCEGCGDCSVQSNCISVAPKETEFGRKREIDQSNCNKDFSCIKGFCPSFVTVHNGTPKKVRTGPAQLPVGALPLPTLPSLDRPFGILVTGVGGTGVITIGAVIGMAAHLEGKGVSNLDQTGLAQKGGAVTSHIRVAARPEDIHAVRIAAGETDALIGCDVVVSASEEVLGKVREGLTRAVVNTHEITTAGFVRNPDLNFPSAALRDVIADNVGADALHTVEATALSTKLMGDSIATNMFMLGYAFQKGLVPVGLDALMKAIELNGVAIKFNKDAFDWGRRAAVDLPAVTKAAYPVDPIPFEKKIQTLDDLIARRTADLTAYQHAAYGARYAEFVRNVARVEYAQAKGKKGLAEAAARYYYKLLAYKDEYEVARLYTDGTFLKNLNATFEGDIKLTFNLAPPLFSPRDPVTGELKKQEYGKWIFGAFKILKKLKFLRGSFFDPFGHSKERKQERQLIKDYEATMAKLLPRLNAENHATIVEIASVPEHIRGYGHVKDRHLKAAKAREAQLLAAVDNPSLLIKAAAE